MTDVFTLLTLPNTSNAFTSLRSTTTETLDYGSASPRRKTARLDTDSDAASASRSNRTRPQGPIKIRIIGNSANKPVEENSHLGLLRRTIRTILTLDASEGLPATYEGIYSACCSVVTVANKGEGLYGIYKLELEQCIGRLEHHLTSHPIAEGEAATWVVELVRVCGWFEKQIVYSGFQNYFVQITHEFYTAESEELSQTMEADPKGFFRHGYLRIEEEEQRVRELLPIGSWAIVRETVEQSLWPNRLEWLANESTLPVQNKRQMPDL
ncbi:hypothetical protein DXG03_004274 [Asterophora parasitica]|uniref:Cullin N-terminal domain-containing protein n=1 Tax=Asterophora parasitica TaxID=117018 RepID=A0A9P7G0B4_9AGAR|nr:hypothetical protein DXG03_004274 [Asterophora parasitica]